jgi:YfiR/HmsC-like
MSHRFPSSIGARIRKWLFGLWFLLVWPGVAAGPTEHEIKASYLLNFIRFTEWPSSAFATTNAPLVVAIIGKDPFGAKIDAIFEGETVHGHPLVLKRVNRAEDAAGAQVVYVPEGERLELGVFRARPVLQVGESRSFIGDGGMVRFSVEKGRVVFDIQRATAEAAGLKINSKLLRLARNVVGEGE